VPVSKLLTKSAVVVPFDVAKPGLGAFSCRVEDEQIYAVQYRRVSWIWFSRDKVNEMTLGTKLWVKEYFRARIFQSEPEGALEVELENGIALDGDYDEYMAVSGDTFVSIL
jgi:hypothetical protein